MRRPLLLLALAPLLASAQTDALLQLDGTGRLLVAEKCSHPLTASNVKVQNPHVDGVVDVVRTMRCPGYSLQYYIAQAYTPSHSLPMMLSITKRHRKLPPQLNIGVAESEVRARLGEPQVKSNKALTYVVGEAGADSITFAIRNGRVVQINWAWDVD